MRFWAEKVSPFAFGLLRLERKVSPFALGRNEAAFRPVHLDAKGWPFASFWGERFRRLLWGATRSTASPAAAPRFYSGAQDRRAVAVMLGLAP